MIFKGLSRSPGLYAGGTVAYTGPGDIVSGALAWWGLRAYNAAYATGSNPAIDVVDTATGLISTTINIKTDGSLDQSTLLGLGYSVAVKKIYDQVGTNHMSQATLADMPVLTASVIGSLSIMTFDSSDGLLAANSITQAQPFTLSTVARRTANPTFNQSPIGFDSGFGILGFRNTSGKLFIYTGGSIPTAPAGTITENVFYALNGVFNGASSIISIDGTETTGLDLGNTTGAFGKPAAGLTTGFVLTGNVAEMGIWPVGFSSGNNSSMSANQHTYWGF